METRASRGGDDRALLGVAIAALALHLLVLTRYGWFRDELYYVASVEHLAWGYVEHPPLSIALLALVKAGLGGSLGAIRIVPALAGAASVFLTGRIARQLGGGRFAQVLAALAALTAPVLLSVTHFYSMNALDLLLWTAAVALLIRCLDGGGRRHWIGLGVTLGLGLLNKISVLWLGAGIAAALLLTPHRRRLATPGPWLAGAIAVAMFVPHLLWQARHDWPTLEFMRNATEHKMVAVSLGAFVAEQLLAMNPGNAPIWVTGLLYGLLAAGGRWRALSIVYLVVSAILVAGGRSRPSYLAVAYPMLLALGAVAIERASAVKARFWLRPTSAGLSIVLGAAALPLALPVLPPETLIRYQGALGLAPSTDERNEMGSLPQHYADMFGWEELAAAVARAHARLTPEERRGCRVFGQNYGEAGAIDVLGRRHGLPAAMSGHNSYWLWGPGDFDGGVLIVIGGDRAGHAAAFDSVEVVETVSPRYAMPYERNLDISICRGLRMPVSEIWPRLKEFM